MTRKVTGRDFIARRPVDARGMAGRKAFAAQRWCEPALKISNDEGNLHEVMKVTLKELSNVDNLDPGE
eukprot:9029962-Pyramimonas_sp.AAC.1